VYERGFWGDGGGGRGRTVIKRVLDGGCGVISGGIVERSRDSGVRVPSGVRSDMGPEEGETGGDISVDGLWACMTFVENSDGTDGYY
jgi:hypothetical protein